MELPDHRSMPPGPRLFSGLHMDTNFADKRIHICICTHIPKINK